MTTSAAKRGSRRRRSSLTLSPGTTTREFWIHSLTIGTHVRQEDGGEKHAEENEAAKNIVNYGTLDRQHPRPSRPRHLVPVGTLLELALGEGGQHDEWARPQWPNEEADGDAPH